MIMMVRNIGLINLTICSVELVSKLFLWIPFQKETHIFFMHKYIYARIEIKIKNYHKKYTVYLNNQIIVVFLHIMINKANVYCKNQYR